MLRSSAPSKWGASHGIAQAERDERRDGAEQFTLHCERDQPYASFLTAGRYCFIASLAPVICE